MAAGIVDSKDILDFEKYLDKKEKEIKCMDHILGPELITIPQYISSSRSIMFTSHLKQFVTLNNPEFPKVFTNYENIFGKLSSALHKAKENCEVYKIIPKFLWNAKQIYTIFFYNKEQNKYFCITKKIAEELTEKASSDDKQYVDSLLGMIKEAACEMGGGDLIVQMKEEDIAKVQGKISSVAADIASATGISTTLAMGDSINTIGGAILKTQSGDIEINNTIEARLDRFKKVLRSEVANVLFN